MYPVIEEVNRKIDVLGSTFDTDIIYQITQMAEVNGVDSEFVKDFMEYLVEKITQVPSTNVLPILYVYDSILKYAGFPYWKESERMVEDFTLIERIVLSAYQKLNSRLHIKVAKLLYIWNKCHIFESEITQPIIDHLGIQELCRSFITTIVHYRQFINPTLISKFNVEVDKLENPDLPILELCKDIANENKNYALDFVNYFVEKTSLISMRRRYPILCLIDMIVKKCEDPYKHYFENQIVKIMVNLYKEGDPYGKIVKVIGIWKECTTFSIEIINNIESALQNLSRPNRQIPQQQSQQSQQQQRISIQQQQQPPLQPIKRQYVNEGYIPLRNVEEVSVELCDNFDTSIYFESNYLDPPTCQYGINEVLKLLKNDFENEDSNIYYSQVKKPQFKLTNQDKITKNKELINLLYQNKQCDLCGLRFPIELLEQHKGDHVNNNSIYNQGTKYRDMFLSIDQYEDNTIKRDTILISSLSNQEDETKDDEMEEENKEDGIVAESLVEVENPTCEYCKGDFRKEWNEKAEEIAYVNMWISYEEGEQQFFHRECYDIVHPIVIETNDQDDEDQTPQPEPYFQPNMPVKREYDNKNDDDEGFELFKKLKT